PESKMNLQLAIIYEMGDPNVHGLSSTMIMAKKRSIMTPRISKVQNIRRKPKCTFPLTMRALPTRRQRQRW
ncbi:MAG TPA: hypothetical protein VI033_04835, partial [Candidatus Nitrosopolaris sp.]